MKKQSVLSFCYCNTKTLSKTYKNGISLLESRYYV